MNTLLYKVIINNPYNQNFCHLMNSYQSLVTLCYYYTCYIYTSACYIVLFVGLNLISPKAQNLYNVYITITTIYVCMYVAMYVHTVLLKYNVAHA